MWSGGLSGLFIALRWITGSASGAKLSYWTAFVTVVFAVCALWLVFRWARRILHPSTKLGRTTLWLGGLSALLVALHRSGLATFVTVVFVFCAFLLTSILQRAGKLNEQIAGELATVSGENFPHRTVTVWRGKQGFTLSARGALLGAHTAEVSDVIKGNSSGFVIGQDRLHLRAVKRYDGDGLPLTVISDVPITPELLQPATARVGSVTVFPPDSKADGHVPPAATASPSLHKRVSAGRVPPTSNWADPTFRFTRYSM